MERYIQIENPNAEKAVLLLHGWMHSSARWHALVDTLKSEYCVIVPDLPGFGRSDPLQPINETTLTRMGNYVLQLAEEVRPGQPLYAVVSHSMGGLVTLESIRQGGRFAQHFVLCDVPVTRPSLIQAFVFIRSLIPFGLRIVKPLPEILRKPVIKLASLPTVKTYGSIDEIFVNDVLRAHPEAAIEILYYIFNNDLLDITYPQLPQSIIARGEYDWIANEESGHLLSEKLGAKYIEFKGSGHTPHLEIQATFNSIIQSYLADPIHFEHPALATVG